MSNTVLRPHNKHLIVALVCITIIISSAAIIVYTQYRYGAQNYDDTSQQDEANQLVERVSKLILLPRDEQPTIATVTRVEELKNQTFFKDAENGDKVLVYPKAKQAILYRPSQNLIIAVAPFTIDSPTTEANAQ